MPMTNRHQTTLYICLSFVLLLILSACDGSSPNRSSAAVPGTLLIGVVPAPPISQIDASSLEPRGLAIELMERIAERSQIEVEFIATDWGNMAAALSSERVDVIIGPIFLTEARAREFLFTDPIWSYGIVAVAMQDNSSIETRDDLISGELSIAVGRGGFDAEFATRIMTNADIRMLPPENPDGAMLEVLAGRSDVALVDLATATRFIAAHEELTIVAGGEPVSLQHAGFMVARNSLQIREFLNIALRNLAISGEMQSIAEPYQQENAFFGMPIIDLYY